MHTNNVRDSLVHLLVIGQLGVKNYLGAFRYVNYLYTDEPGDPAAVAYGPNYPRLREIKKKYDPENFFHTNVNIRPS